MLRTLTDRPTPQSQATARVIAAVQADIIVLSSVDWDAGLLGLRALRDRVADAGWDYPYFHALEPVSGAASGLDLDGDGRLGEPEDSLGYGWFRGDGGLAILSRVPLSLTDIGRVPWAETPGSAAHQVLPEDGVPLVPIASRAIWAVSLTTPKPLTLITFSASPPVFDGAEDRNGLRNRDELRHITRAVTDWPNAMVVGRTNLDPADGEGYRATMQALLNHPDLQDPRPTSPGGTHAPNPDTHTGNPALDTADWGRDPGPMRVDYVLPPRGATLTGSAVLWPTEGPLAQAVQDAGSGRPVWVDLRF